MLLQPLVDRHAILAMEKQLRLFDVIGVRRWDADLEAGTLTFSAPKKRLRRAEAPLVMRASLLGTQAHGSWLWGWANPGAFPEPVVAAGRAVADYGREHDLPPLYEPESAVTEEDVNCTLLAIVAAGVVPLAATYRAPVDETQIVFGLEHPELALGAVDLPRLVTVLTTLVKGGLVHDWPAACAAYAEQRGVSFDGRRLAGAIEIELDELGRLSEVSARIGG